MYLTITITDTITKQDSLGKILGFDISAAVGARYAKHVWKKEEKNI